MSRPINAVAVLTSKDGKFDKILSAFVCVAEYIHTNEPGTLIFYAFKPTDGDELVVVEKYLDEDSRMTHVESVAFQEFRNKVLPLLAKPFDVKKGTYLAGLEAREGHVKI
ncbi:hypothetical protein BDV41DRAFT_577920 [Aspergillus transmontanensis]|uniref:ABM domain-containing protein n=1 Tax=Aspergillus transmontanensis TaxID=1034304 RepID=A0A5N6VYA7_9EURO|nr:hypothetical protein BDV41DRAFT_577920 [Aspergillus transmontanensis]